MSKPRWSAPEGVCTVPGCNQPRHVTRSGLRLTRCTEHYREWFKVNNNGGSIPKKRRPRKADTQAAATSPDVVEVLVIDWQTEQVLRVTGSVNCSEPFPKTDGDMKKIIAQASRAGVYVAYIRAWKKEDL